MTPIERGELMRRLWLAAADASDAALLALVEQAEGRPVVTLAAHPANDAHPAGRVAEFAIVPPPRAGELGRRTCYLCNRWLCAGAPGPVVQLPDGRWRCGTVVREGCPTRQQAPARDTERHHA